jgi:hypothetical protein
VIDTGTNTVLTQLKGGFRGFSGSNDTSGPNGVLIVRHREVWVGDAPCPASTPANNNCAPVGPSSVKVIDLFSQKLTHTISTGGSARADEMCWDPRDHLLMVANNADSPPFATLIDTRTYSVVKKFTFDGSTAPKSNNGIEQCQWDHRTGKFYITVPGLDGHPAGEGSVAVFDPVSKTLVNNIVLPVAKCDTPQGMAVGPDHQILIGCNGSASTTKSSVVIDDRNGHIIATVANESGPDMVWFNDGDGHYFLARSGAGGPSFPNQLLGVIDADSPGAAHDEQPGGDIKADADVITGDKLTAGRNAHSVAADAFLNHVFVPIPAAASTICSSVPGGANDADGCIAVLAAPHDDHPEHDHH